MDWGKIRTVHNREPCPDSYREVNVSAYY